MRPRMLLLAALPVTLLFGVVNRETAWRQDVDYFVAGFSAPGMTIDMQRGPASKGQKDFAKLYPNPVFTQEVDALKADIPKLSESEVLLRLMKIVAMANVAHNIVQLPNSGFGFDQRLPLTFGWFPEGLVVGSASPQYSEAIGAIVVDIGGIAPEKLLEASSPYISHETRQWLRLEFTEFIRGRAALEHFSLPGPDGDVALHLRKADGSTLTINVAPVDLLTPRITMTEALHLPVPLFHTMPGKYYWHKYLDDSHTLFIQYNRCANDPKLPFHDFAAQVLADADSHEVRRIVIDLRLNGGGDSGVIGPLKSGLESRLKKLGPVYVIIGPGTFSSAQDNAFELRKTLHAKTVGEPTGERPSGYGEVKKLTLPNSKLVVQFTSKYFKFGGGDALLPAIPAQRTLADVLAGRDPALEAAIADSH